MALGPSPLSVCIERQTDDLGVAMSGIRAWLDTRKMQPTSFKTSPCPSGGITIDIQFRTEDEAYLFEKAFG